MSNYKSKTPEEAFERSQAAHVKSATLQAYDQHPRGYRSAYRKKVFATIEKKIMGGKK